MQNNFLLRSLNYIRAQPTFKTYQQRQWFGFIPTHTNRPAGAQNCQSMVELHNTNPITKLAARPWDPLPSYVASDFVDELSNHHYQHAMQVLHRWIALNESFNLICGVKNERSLNLTDKVR